MFFLWAAPEAFGLWARSSVEINWHSPSSVKGATQIYMNSGSGHLGSGGGLRKTVFVGEILLHVTFSVQKCMHVEEKLTDKSTNPYQTKILCFYLHASRTFKFTLLHQHKYFYTVPVGNQYFNKSLFLQTL